MQSISSTQIGTFIGRVLRFGLGITLAWIAYAYDEPWMYAAGTVVFATGFLKPRRCEAEGCNLPH